MVHRFITVIKSNESHFAKIHKRKPEQKQSLTDGRNVVCFLELQPITEIIILVSSSVNIC